MRWLQISGLLRAFHAVTLPLFISTSLYRRAISVIRYVLAHLYCTYSGSSSFTRQLHMARSGIRSESLSACQATVTSEVQLGSVRQLRRIKSVLRGTETESEMCYKFIDTNKSDTFVLKYKNEVQLGSARQLPRIQIVLGGTETESARC